MSAGLHFLLDEHLGGPIWNAVQMYNARPGVQPVTVFQVGVPPAPPKGTDDPELLAWAEVHDCILVTLDRDTMVAHFHRHLASGRGSPGVFILPPRFPIPNALESLALAAHASEPSEWRDQVTFL